jgi:hypothetical protein
LVDTRVHFEHIQVNRCDIELESVEKCRDVENEPVSEESMGIPLGPIFKTPSYFLENKESIFET